MNQLPWAVAWEVAFCVLGLRWRVEHRDDQLARVFFTIAWRHNWNGLGEATNHALGCPVHAGVMLPLDRAKYDEVAIAAHVGRVH